MIYLFGRRTQWEHGLSVIGDHAAVRHAFKLIQRCKQLASSTGSLSISLGPCRLSSANVMTSKDSADEKPHLVHDNMGMVKVRIRRACIS